MTIFTGRGERKGVRVGIERRLYRGLPYATQNARQDATLKSEKIQVACCLNTHYPNPGGKEILLFQDAGFCESARDELVDLLTVLAWQLR